MTAVVSYAVFCVIVIGSHGFISGPSIPGGIHNVKVNDPGVIQAALFAVSSLGPGNSLIAVVKAKRQVRCGHKVVKINIILTTFGLMVIVQLKDVLIRIYNTLLSFSLLIYALAVILYI